MKKFLTTLSILLIASTAHAKGEIYPQADFKVKLPIGKTSETKLKNTYTVERVIDGDTIVVTTPEGKSEKVQLIGIETPQTVYVTSEFLEASKRWGTGYLREMGQEAKEFLESRISDWRNEEVLLEFDVEKRDKYGRLLAYVWYVGDSSMKGDLWDRNIAFGPWEKKMNEAGESLDVLFINAVIVKAGYAQPMTIPPNVKYVELFQKLYEEAREAKRGLWKNDDEQVTSNIFEEFEEVFGMSEDDLNDEMRSERIR